MTRRNESSITHINFVQIQVNTETLSSILSLWTVIYDILYTLLKKTIPPAHTKINILVREKVIYNELIKFELN